MRINLIAFFLLIFSTSCSRQDDSNPSQLSAELPPWELAKAHLPIDEYQIGELNLCGTTLSELNSLDQEFEKYQVDELDLGNSKLVQDGRYENSVGYASVDVPGIIFQKEGNTEVISKVRFVPPFKGTMKGVGQFELGKLKVSEVSRLLQGFHWTTRDNSDYWRFTNDTISFYVRINASIQRYPLDESYYANKNIAAIEIVNSCYNVYGPKFSKEDTIYQKPLYAPLADKHMNKYILTKRNDIETMTKELLTFGKKTNYKITRFGLWLEFDSKHRITVEEFYDNTGKLVEKKK